MPFAPRGFVFGLFAKGSSAARSSNVVMRAAIREASLPRMSSAFVQAEIPMHDPKVPLNRLFECFGRDLEEPDGIRCGFQSGPREKQVGVLPHLVGRVRCEVVARDQFGFRLACSGQFSTRFHHSRQHNTKTVPVAACPSLLHYGSTLHTNRNNAIRVLDLQDAETNQSCQRSTHPHEQPISGPRGP